MWVIFFSSLKNEFFQHSLRLAFNFFENTRKKLTKYNKKKHPFQYAQSFSPFFFLPYFLYFVINTCDVCSLRVRYVF